MFLHFSGCKAANSDEQCYACRVVKEAGTNRCLEECPSTSMINKKKECVSKFIFHCINLPRTTARIRGVGGGGSFDGIYSPTG